MNHELMLYTATVAFFVLLTTSVAIIIRDVRQKRVVEGEKRRLSNYLKLLLESTGEGVYGMDLEGRCTFINRAGASLIGFRPEEVIGKNMHALIHARHADGSPYPEAECPILQTVQRGDDYRIRDEALWRKGDTSFPAWYSAYPIREDGKIVGAVVIFTNISQQKKIEKMKNEFISTVSHELRTPLTSIRGSLGLIADGMAGSIPEQVKTLLNIAVNNCERLVRLINDILDIEKIESGKISFKIKPVALTPLVKQSIETMRSYADEHGVRLVLEDESVEILAAVDTDRFLQVMTNLLSNAIKFSSKGESVCIRVSRRGSFVRISVADRGPGIADEFKDRIFGKFVQADSSHDRSRGGTGLGLSICKAIIEKLGGAIYFETGKNGTTFYFDLPEWGEAKTSAPKEKSGSRPRLLICEDDHDFAALLTMMMDRMGVDSDVAYSVAEAKKLLNTRPYDGMTMDLILPDQDGASFLKELSEGEKTRTLPVIVVSFKASPTHRQFEANALQVVDWIDKPLDQGRLVMAVQRALQGRRDEERSRILHVEDDADTRQWVQIALKDVAVVTSAGDLREARRRLEGDDYDLMILDLSLPDGNGADLLPFVIRPGQRSLPILVFSAHEIDPDLAQKVAASLVKSRSSNEELLATIRSLLSKDSGLPETPVPGGFANAGLTSTRPFS